METRPLCRNRYDSARYKTVLQKNGVRVFSAKENISDRPEDNCWSPCRKDIIASSTTQRLDELETAKEDLAISIAQAEIQKPVLTKEQIIFWINRFKKGDKNSPEYRRRLIDTFVNAIYLFDDRIVLTYNYKDGSQTVTLAEVEETFGSRSSGSDLTGWSVPETKAIQAGGFCFCTTHLEGIRSRVKKPVRWAGFAAGQRGNEECTRAAALFA